MNSQPATRDLATVVAALEVTLGELQFQISRLDTSVTPDTANESEHLADLCKGYKGAQRYIGILHRYQKGRLDKQRNNEKEANDAQEAAIDAAGRATAYTGDD